MRQGIAVVLLDGFQKLMDRQIDAVELLIALQVAARLEIEVVGARHRRRADGENALGGGGNRRPQHRRHLAHDAVLHRADLLQLEVERTRVQLPQCDRVHQVDRHTDPRRRALHAAADHPRHAEDAVRVARAGHAFAPHVARRHDLERALHLSNLRELRGQDLDQTVAERLARRVVADVGERQDDELQPRGQLRRGGPPRQPLADRRRRGQRKHGEDAGAERDRRGDRPPPPRPRDQHRARAAVALEHLTAEHLQVVREIHRRGVAVLRAFGQTAFDDRAQQRRQVAPRLDRPGLVLDDRGEGLDVGGPPERAVPGGHFVEHRPEAELIGAVVHLVSARLLRGHVVGRADQRADRGQPGFVLHRLRVRTGVSGIRGERAEPEVEHLDEPVPGHHHVLRLEIAVDDPGFVRLGDRAGDLRRDLHDARKRQPAGGDQLVQRLAVDQLHRDVGDAFRTSDAVDRDDVRVIEGRSDARFALEARKRCRTWRGRFFQDLDGDKAGEVGIARAVDLSHAAAAKQRHEFIRAEPGACLERHLGETGGL